MGIVKEIVMSHYYRFYPPSLIFDLALTTPLPEGECRIVVDLLKHEFDKYGTYLAFLNYYINKPYDLIEGDFEREVEKLKILKQIYWMTA
jgi:hypothetical protein